MATGSHLLSSVRRCGKECGSVWSCSLDCALFAERLSVLEHTPFLPTEACILDCHAEERVFVLLVVGGKGVLVKQHQFRVVRAGFREFGKLRSDFREQREAK